MRTQPGRRHQRRRSGSVSAPPQVRAALPVGAASSCAEVADCNMTAASGPPSPPLPVARSTAAVLAQQPTASSSSKKSTLSAKRKTESASFRSRYRHGQAGGACDLMTKSWLVMPNSLTVTTTKIDDAILLLKMPAITVR